jgi:hypothetical protein
MDVFALLFILSFLALIFTLAVMHIRKCIKTKDNVAKGSKHIGWVSDVLGRGSSKSPRIYGNSNVEFIDCRWDDESWMQREVNEAQEKWKLTLPKHSTRIKLRNSRKLRNKRKGKK